MIYMFFANGFEEIEALATVDILRRCEFDVKMVNIDPTDISIGAHDIPVLTDSTFTDEEFNDIDAIILPGGLPGAQFLMECDPLCDLIKTAHAEGKLIAAICAAPMVLGHCQILKNKRVTCYPGVESQLKDAVYTGKKVEVDGNIVTGCGPAAAPEFAFEIARQLGKAAVAEQVKAAMQF